MSHSCVRRSSHQSDSSRVFRVTTYGNIDAPDGTSRAHTAGDKLANAQIGSSPPKHSTAFPHYPHVFHSLPDQHHPNPAFLSPTHSLGSVSPTSPKLAWGRDPPKLSPRSLDGAAAGITGIPEADSNGNLPDEETVSISGLKHNVVVESKKSNQVYSSILNAKSRVVNAIAKRGRLYATRKTDRLVGKEGDVRISTHNVEKRRLNFFRDFFTTTLEMKWRYHVLLFLAVFLSSWLFFALIWWFTVVLDYHVHVSSLIVNSTKTASVEYTPCVDGVYDFASALLFSIETQHTIGYGTRAITTSCPGSFIILILQSAYGVAMQCVLTGIIFAKLARPIRRAKTIMFSKNAVICQRDGDLCLMFRVGDMRKSSLLSVNIQALYVTRRTTEEGEDIPIAHKLIKLTSETEDDFFFLAWPILVLHKIDENSPLWEISAEQLLVQQFEIVVVIECVAEMTGASMQVI